MDHEQPAPADASGLATQLTAQDPAVGLNAVWALRTLLDQVERAQVDNARTQHWSWQDIARTLRVSRQSVHEKHAPRRKTMGLEA
jgi:hypothetical protein